VGHGVATANGVHATGCSAKRAKILQRWNPVRHNYTRQLALDNSGKVFNLTTMGMDPPIFEIDNFLTPAECEHLRGLAGQTGFFKSDSTYLDGSNLGDENVKKEGMSLEEANKLFRHSEQTWLEHDRDPLLQAMMDRVMNLGKSSFTTSVVFREGCSRWPWAFSQLSLGVRLPPPCPWKLSGTRG